MCCFVFTRGKNIFMISIVKRICYMVHLILSKVRGMLKFIFFGVLKHFPFSMLGLQHYILFESYPQLDCSPWMIYQEMKKRGFEKKYKLVWAVEASFVAPKNVCCIPFFCILSFFQRVKRIYCISNSKLIVDSNRFVEKINKKLKKDNQN